MSLRSSRLGLALLIAASISCNDTVTGPAPVVPDGAIVLGDSVLTRGAVVRASIAAPAGFVVVPGSVAWTVTSGGATVVGVGGAEDSVDVALTADGALQLTARYKLRGNLGAGSSVTIVGPSSRSTGDVVVQSTRSLQVASPLLDYEILPPASVTAGTPFGEVRVVLKDARGRVLTGAADSVVIALDPTSGTPGATLLGTVRTKAVAGVATFRGKSIQRAGVGYRLIASSPTVTSRDTAATTVVAAAPSASQSGLAVRDTVLAVGAGTTVTVTLRDQYGNPVLTATPAAFLPSRTAGTLATFTCTNGVCTATYTAPTAPDTPILTATIGGTAITGAPRPVSVRAGAAARLKITGDTTQVAGASNVLVVTALDAFANVATSYTGTKRLTFAGASLAPIGTAPKIAATNVQTTADVTFDLGVARLVTSVLVKAERALLETTDGTISAAGGDRLPVRVIANVPDAGQSTILVADSARFGGQTTTVTITLRDAYGNPVLNGDANAFTPSVPGGTLGAFTCVDGVCTATYTAPPANGPQTVTASIGGTPVKVDPTGTATVQVVFDNTAPVITGPSGGAGAAASAKSVPENTIAVHTFTANEPTTWSLTGDDAARFAIDPTTGALVFVAAPDFERPADADENNVYVVTVTATDAAGNVSTQVLTVTITNVDEIAPRITGPTGAAGDAISAKSVPENTAPVHRFTASEEVTWSIDGGEDAGAFTMNAVTGALVFRTAPNFEAPTDANRDNRYVVIVAATDPAGNIGRQTVTVTVTDVDEVPPKVTGPTGGAGAPTSTKSLPENTAAVTTFTADEPVTWSLAGGADAARFAIDPVTGALTFIAPPDFENPLDADGNNTYVVTVKAIDAGGNEVTQTLTVTITNIDETAPGILGPSGAAGDPTSAKAIPEGTTAIHTFTSGEDVEWGVGGGADAARFSINPFSGVLTLRAAPDFETPTDADLNNTYVVIITAVDPAGNISRQTLTVTVTDVDEIAPRITGPSGAPGDAATAKSVRENSTAVHTFTANESVTWSIQGGADAARFAIDPLTGALTFVTPPDFEAPVDADGNNVYLVTIKAVDAAGNISTQTVTITVTDADEAAPRITGPSGDPGDATSAKSVPENTTPVFTFTANEPVTWAIAGGADAARFTIDPSTGALVFAPAPDFEAPTDADGNNTYVVTVRATDAAGNVSTQTLTVTVTDADDRAPVITGPSGAGVSPSAKSIPENQTAVYTFTADEPVTWSLPGGGADRAKFSIDPATGALTFIAPPDFENPTDAGGDNTYEVVVQARDAAGNLSTQTLIVTVTNVDDNPPRITGPGGVEGAAATAVSIPENTTAVFDRFRANEDVSWSFDAGGDAAALAINAATGVVTFPVAPDYERPTDADQNNTYVVTIKATDLAGNVSRQTLTVTVTNVNEAAKLVITGAGTMVAGASQTITVTAYDARGAVERAYSGTKSLTFSGASVAPNGTTNPTVSNTTPSDVNFGASTSVAFSNGVASGTMFLYAAETAVIATTDGTIGAAGGDRLTVVVDADNASPVVSSLTATPATIQANGTSTSTLSLQLKDVHGNPTAKVSSVSFSKTAGDGSLTGSVTNAGGGLYTQRVQSPLIAGTGTFNANIGGTPSTQSAVISYVTGLTALDRVVCQASQPAAQSAVSSVTVNLCAATKVGDLEIVTLALDLTVSDIDDVSAPAVSGLDGTWVKILSQIQGVRGGGNKPMLLVVYARRYALNNQRTVTFTAGTNHKWSVDMVTLLSSVGAIPSGPDIQAVKNATGSTLVTPGLVAGAENTVVLYVMANSLTGNTVTATNSATLTALSNNNSGGTSSTSFLELLANGATAPSRTWTSTKSANTVLMQLLVRP